MAVRNHSVQYVGNYMLILTEPEREISKIIWCGKTFVPEVKHCFVDDLIELANDLERVKDGSLGAPWLEDLGEIAKRIRYYCGVDDYVN